MNNDVFIVVLDHKDHSILLTKSKSEVAKHCGVCYNTIHRISKKGPVYSASDYDMWFGVVPKRLKRGFKKK